MRLIDLLKLTSWSEIENEIEELFGREDIRFFKRLYFKLLNIDEKDYIYLGDGNGERIGKSREIVVIKEVEFVDEFSKEKLIYSWEVAAIEDGLGEYLGIDILLHEMLLPFKVHLGEYSPARFLALCLEEMSYLEEDKKKEIFEFGAKIEKGEYRVVYEDCTLCDDGDLVDRGSCICEDGKIGVVVFDGEESD